MQKENKIYFDVFVDNVYIGTGDDTGRFTLLTKYLKEQPQVDIMRSVVEFVVCKPNDEND